MNPTGQQPIQDVVPPHDSLGNPENFSEVPVQQAPVAAPEAATNPIAGGTLTRPPQQEQPQPDAHKEDMDKVLKDVNKEVKNTVPKKPREPAKPIVQIVLATIVALVLAVIAFMAFHKSG